MIIEKKNNLERANTLAERFSSLEKELALIRKQKETIEKSKQFEYPKRWKRLFKRTRRKKYSDMILVIFLNKKNQIEKPKFMPIYDGNMIIWKNKPYEFDPRAVWSIRGVKGNPQVYLIKEIDRRPVRNKYGKAVYTDSAVSNQDLDDIRLRGDSTESDAFLIKAIHMAKMEAMKARKVNWVVLGIVAIVVIGGLIWFLNS